MRTVLALGFAANALACAGDTIHWVFAGSDAKEFKAKFANDDSPFGWPDGTSRGASVNGTVQPGAVKNGRSTDYPYDVEIDGALVDPKIIIEP